MGRKKVSKRELRNTIKIAIELPNKLGIQLKDSIAYAEETLEETLTCR